MDSLKEPDEFEAIESFGFGNDFFSSFSFSSLSNLLMSVLVLVGVLTAEGSIWIMDWSKTELRGFGL